MVPRRRVGDARVPPTPFLLIYPLRTSKRPGSALGGSARQGDAGDLRRLGEKLVAKYMDEVAPTVEPAAVELDVQGEISGVSVRGRVDVLDVEGRLIDFKTASRRPSCVSPDYAFQLATYQQITPGARGEVRIDSLVKTQTVQIVQQAYTVEEPDIRATQVLYPMAQKAMGSGTYCPNRQSMLCSQKHCSFWKHCEEEFGGRVRSA